MNERKQNIPIKDGNILKGVTDFPAKTLKPSSDNRKTGVLFAVKSLIAFFMWIIATILALFADYFVSGVTL